MPGRSDVIRYTTGANWGWLAALGGLLWITKGLLTAAIPAGKPGQEYYNAALDQLYAVLFIGVGPLLFAAGLIALRARLTGLLSVAGQWAAYVCAGASAINIVYLMLAGAQEPGLLMGLVFVTGPIALLLATVLLGIATLRVKLLGHWSGLLLAIGVLGPMLFPLGGVFRNAGHWWYHVEAPVVLLGLAWTCIGYLLWRGLSLR